MKERREVSDPREVKLIIIINLLIACGFAYMVYLNCIQPPIHEVVIREVFDVQHPNGAYTTVDTWGQGRYSFIGVYDFREGHSYRIRFVSVSNPFGKYRIIEYQELPP